MIYYAESSFTTCKKLLQSVWCVGRPDGLLYAPRTGAFVPPDSGPLLLLIGEASIGVEREVLACRHGQGPSFSSFGAGFTFIFPALSSVRNICRRICHTTDAMSRIGVIGCCLPVPTRAGLAIPPPTRQS
jgi:hypothetical protein